VRIGPERTAKREGLAADLGLDRQRMREWAIVHALAWGVSGTDKLEEEMVACARWLAQS
jgi:hypothetical protein